ncbi:951c8ebe-5e63-49da-a55d-8ee5a39f4df0 [Sclerotinia trifoliorum]|uniref:951c8ebe-5e63-49da-a55d-8ee5a39f4df0 n=1 Tax=Sclerotinia trifoliorum TaxID=28548 RepID=A0A8H2W3L9_9HELO|nr:951c8ebe-5e63-49da-a55d-8ee5a39f4df0 [Sclerotinia trifoliorum]
MAPKSTTLTTKVESGSPYQLDHDQVLKASTALVKHISSTEAEKAKKAGAKNLLAENDDDDAESTPVWLTLTTKKHITDKTKLKPVKVTVPHSLNTSSTTSICLIVADPQRTYKDIVASAAFPAELSKRITKVVGVDKLKKKYKQYEAQRKLFAEHDIFVADDRIITLLPKLLGKNFYKSTTKRPIPVSIQAEAPKSEGKRIARAKGEDAPKSAEPKKIAAEIEKAISSALLTLSSSTNSAIRIGYASWDAAKLAENLEVVANTVIEKYVPKKWRGVRAIHVKGPETMALPLWLADELWVEDEDVLDESVVREIEERAAEKKNKKRKSRGIEGSEVEEKGGEEKKQKLLESNDDKLDKEIALRKEMLKKQKEDAAKDLDAIPVVVKKTKKTKKVVA